MSAASDLIERAEQEGGGRIDDPASSAMEILVGALAREMGHHEFEEKDDLAVGILILGEKRRKQEDEALRSLLALGLSPNDIHRLNGGG